VQKPQGFTASACCRIGLWSIGVSNKHCTLTVHLIRKMCTTLFKRRNSIQFYLIFLTASLRLHAFSQFTNAAYLFHYLNLTFSGNFVSHGNSVSVIGSTDI